MSLPTPKHYFCDIRSFSGGSKVAELWICLDVILRGFKMQQEEIDPGQPTATSLLGGAICLQL